MLNMKKTVEHWSKRLDRALKEKGWNRSYFAKLTGVPYESVIKYCNGKIDQPRGDQMDIMAAALGTTAAWLSHGVGRAPWEFSDNSGAGPEPPAADATFGGVATKVMPDGTLKITIEINIKPQ